MLSICVYIALHVFSSIRTPVTRTPDRLPLMFSDFLCSPLALPSYRVADALAPGRDHRPCAPASSHALSTTTLCTPVGLTLRWDRYIFLGPVISHELIRTEKTINRKLPVSVFLSGSTGTLKSAVDVHELLIKMLSSPVP